MGKSGGRLDFDRDHVIYDDFLLVRKGTQSCKKKWEYKRDRKKKAALLLAFFAAGAVCGGATAVQYQETNLRD